MCVCVVWGGGGGGRGEVFNKIAPFLLINFGAEKEGSQLNQTSCKGEISRGAAVQDGVRWLAAFNESISPGRGAALIIHRGLKYGQERKRRRKNKKKKKRKKDNTIIINIGPTYDRGGRK